MFECNPGLIDHCTTPLKLRKLSAQRLAAQPLGHFRYLAIILADILKPHFSVHSLSLGQVGCSRVLGVFKVFHNTVLYHY
jgi:hypothetical protein